MQYPIKSILLLITILLLLGSCSNGNDAPNTNVLVILVDDMGYDDLDISNPDTMTPTPNMDMIAQEGVRFDRHYTDSTCSPTRSALLSGQYPARNGFEPNGRGLSPDVLTIADVLKIYGYRTYHVGKWHTGNTVRQAWPDRQGFDHWFGFLDQWQMGEGLDEADQVVFADPTYRNPWLRTDSNPPSEYAGHLTDILTDHVVSLIEDGANSEQPWFINLWYFAPHAPIDPDDRYLSQYPDTPNGRYLALLNQLDDSIGRLMSALQRTGQADRTLVVLASDNGGTNYFRDNNYPFRGEKVLYEEGGIRTPLIIRWPQQLPPGVVVSETVTIYDIFPSILSLLRLPIPMGLDGIDFTPAISGTALPRRPLFWEFYYNNHFGYSVLSLDGQWRLYKSWPWTDWETPSQLFDLGTDYTGHLLAENPDVQSALESEYVAWHEQIHRVDVQLGPPDLHGRRIVTGADMQRTPGFGGFTFAIGAYPSGVENGLNTVIAVQPDIWSLLSTNGQLKLQIASWTIDVPVSLVSGCNSIVVTGNFEQRITNWEGNDDVFEVRVYLNGNLVGELQESEKVVGEPYLEQPTYIGSNFHDGGEMNFGGNLTAPIFLNRSVDLTEPLSVTDLGAELCPG